MLFYSKIVQNIIHRLSVNIDGLNTNQKKRYNSMS